jgi:hypothetical protein
VSCQVEVIVLDRSPVQRSPTTLTCHFVWSMNFSDEAAVVRVWLLRQRMRIKISGFLAVLIRLSSVISTLTTGNYVLCSRGVRKWQNVDKISVKVSQLFQMLKLTHTNLYAQKHILSIAVPKTQLILLRKEIKLKICGKVYLSVSPLFYRQSRDFLRGKAAGSYSTPLNSKACKTCCVNSTIRLD